MGFIEASKNVFIKWKDFDSRISRSEYWWGNLGVTIISLLLGLAIGLLAGFGGAALGYSLGAIQSFGNVVLLPWYVFSFIAGLSLVARRLHDVNKSGWWILIFLTIVGMLFLIYWYCKKGDAGDNRFGKNPLNLHAA
ncbi:DUF805 domain-containing protein [Porticoccaceae bacterium]|jgi:uncharacterized membrane protein YhaH (DUF805 family)|nr:DUF805 domain-containing protein [Porticoccaceae bacterium]|tara:strand:- start:88 stop:498 length:411 start_codon:yes stop_codon:yes gene_type:complete